MSKPEPRLPSPYRPDPDPHTTRLITLVALILGTVLFTAWLAWQVGDDTRVPQDGLVRPTVLPTDTLAR